MIRPALALLAGVATLGLLAACPRASPTVESVAQDRSPIDDDVAPLRELDANVDVVMTGVMVPEAEVILVATDFARVIQLDVHVGDHVSEGAVVAALDVRGRHSDLFAATEAWRASAAELDRLSVELRQARAARAEVETLASIVAEAELRERRFAEELAAARRRGAKAAVHERRAQVNRAELRVAESELRSPFSGVVARRFVDPGTTLAAGQPVVELLSDVHRLRFAVPEEHSDLLGIGALIRVSFEGGVEQTSTVTTIAPEIEAGTRLIFAEAPLTLSPAEVERLRVGAVARVRFVRSSGPRTCEEPTVVLPRGGRYSEAVSSTSSVRCGLASPPG